MNLIGSLIIAGWFIAMVSIWVLGATPAVAHYHDWRQYRNATRYMRGKHRKVVPGLGDLELMAPQQAEWHREYRQGRDQARHLAVKAHQNGHAPE